MGHELNMGFHLSEMQGISSYTHAYMKIKIEIVKYNQTNVTSSAKTYLMDEQT